MIPLQIGELHALPLNSAVQLGLHLHQPVVLFSERADCGGPISKLAFNVSQRLPEGLHLGQDGGSTCGQTSKLKKENSSRQVPDR